MSVTNAGRETPSRSRGVRHWSLCSTAGQPGRAERAGVIRVAATVVGGIVRAAPPRRRPPAQRAGALRRVTGDKQPAGLDEILERVVGHAAVLFSADRVSAFLLEEEGRADGRSAACRSVDAVSTLEGPPGRVATPPAGPCSPSITPTTRGRVPGRRRRRLDTVHRAAVRRRRPGRSGSGSTTTARTRGRTTSSTPSPRSRRRPASRSRPLRTTPSSRPGRHSSSRSRRSVPA
jgi:hypothetical protein